MHDLAVSPNGQLLASAGEDMTVKLWTASNGAAQPNPAFDGFTGPVRQVAFSPDSSRLVAGNSIASEVKVFDVASRTLEQTLTGHANPVTGLVSAGTHLPKVFSVTEAGVREQPLLQRGRLEGHNQPLTSIAALPGPSPQVITGSRDGTVRHWNLRTRAAIRSMNHGAPVTDVAVRPDGGAFASASENNTARLWNATNGSSIAELKGDIRVINQLARDEQELALAGGKVESATERLEAAQDRVAALETRVENSKTDVTEAEQPVRSVEFSPDGRLLVTAGDNQRAHTWSAETGEPIATFLGHTDTVGHVVFAGDSELLSGSADSRAFAWNAEPGWELDHTIGSVDDATVLSDRVMALDLNSDGSLLVAGGGIPSRYGEVKLFNTADGSLVRTLREPHTDGVLGVAFSPDGSKIATCGADKYVKVFDTASGELIRPFEGHTEYVLDVTWRSDSRALATCGADNTIRVWNAETGELTRTITGFDKQVTDVRFIGDSNNTVSSSGDTTVRLHRTDNGQNFRTLQEGTDFMYCVDATPDSRFIVAGGFDSVLRIWNGNNGQVLHELSPSIPPGESVAAEGQ